MPPPRPAPNKDRVKLIRDALIGLGGRPSREIREQCSSDDSLHWYKEEEHFLQDLYSWRGFLATRDQIRMEPQWGPHGSERFRVFKQHVQAYLRRKGIEDDRELLQIRDDQTKLSMWTQYEILQLHRVDDEKGRVRRFGGKSALQDLDAAEKRLEWIRAQFPAIAAESAVPPSDDQVRYYQEQARIYQEREDQERVLWAPTAKQSAASQTSPASRKQKLSKATEEAPAHRPKKRVARSQKQNGKLQKADQQASSSAPKSQSRTTNRVVKRPKPRPHQGNTKASIQISATADSSGPVSSRLRSRAPRPA